MLNRRGLLQLEGLTERIVPAVSIRAVDGDLVISGIANTDGSGASAFQKLWVNVTADNQVTIQDGGSAFGTLGAKGVDRGIYAVTGDLIFNLSNRSDQVTIDFTGAFTLDGGITANFYNGNDSLTITNSGDADSGIFGSLTVDGGNGNDNIVVRNDSGTPSKTLTIEGAISFNGGAGTDSATINGTNAAELLSIGAGLTLTRVNTVNVGTVADVNISGNTTFNSSADKLIENQFNLGGAKINIGGALSITGGQGKDTVNLDTVNIVDVVPAQDEVLEISMNLDRGENNTTLTDIQFGINGTDADFAYTGGTGIDNVTFNNTNTVSGSANFTFGNGSNSLTVSSGTTFDSSVTVTGGKADDTVTLNNSAISGFLTVTLGNGTNGLTTGSGVNSTIAGGLTYTGGNNTDTVTLAHGDGLAGDISISTGAGGDSVTISNTANVAVTSLTVDLGIDSIGDTLIYDSVFDSLITILNQGSSDSVTSV